MNNAFFVYGFMLIECLNNKVKKCKGIRENPPATLFGNMLNTILTTMKVFYKYTILI